MYDQFYSAKNKYHNTDILLTDLPCDWRSTAPWMKLFRKEFIINNDLKFLEGIRGAEDISFSWVAYFIAKRISFCEDVYYCYNLTPESLDRCVDENILDIFDALSFAKSEYQRFDVSHARNAQLDTLYVSHIHYQFTKITKANICQSDSIAAMYWDKAHKTLSSIPKINILKNKYLHKVEKEYYLDVIMHPSLDIAIQKKYYTTHSKK